MVNIEILRHYFAHRSIILSKFHISNENYLLFSETKSLKVSYYSSLQDPVLFLHWDEVLLYV